MARLYRGTCKKCLKQKDLIDNDAVGMSGLQDTSMNGICGECRSNIQQEHNNKINNLSIEERLAQIERKLKIRY